MTWVPLNLWRAALLERWKRMVRYLARDEISQAYEGGAAWAQALNQVNTQALQSLAFAQGECSGRQEVIERIDAIVAQRTMGFGDYISAEDLAQAKKGLIH